MLLVYRKDSKLIFLDLTGQLHHLQKIYVPHLKLYNCYFLFSSYRSNYNLQKMLNNTEVTSMLSLTP